MRSGWYGALARSAGIVAGLALMLASPAPAQQAESRGIFPYDYAVDELPNGLRLVTVPTDDPNLVALYIVVRTGSRNEVEPGKSGYAHFFEHLMFRGSENYTPEERDAILKRAGASANAYTSDDRTVYHEVFAREDLAEVMKLEADRFQRLQYGEDVFRTEALAVLGEYNKNSSNPISKLYETLRATAFDQHTYRHTTMGFLEDIQSMPEQYEYSLTFYDRYYRPEYATIVVVGDVTREETLALTREHFGEWERGSWNPEIPREPEQTAPRSAHVDWPTQTLPYLAVAYKAPAFSVETRDMAALDLLTHIAFGPTSELYQRLVLQEQKVDLLSPWFGASIDPELFTVIARVKDPKDVEEVQRQVLETYRRFAEEPVEQAKLDAVRSNLKYSFALAMNSSEAIADALAPYIALAGSPAAIDELFALYERITPEDMRAAAARYFVPEHRTIVTLTSRDR